MKVVRTRSGARLIQGGLILSELRAEPGPTHTLFDVLGAALAALSPGPRVAILGFAAGGVVAPMRALGFAGPIHAVDLDLRGEGLFRHLSGGWAGEVSVAHEDAAAFLRRPATPWDAILDDLSVERDGVVTKPRASLGDLPGLAATRLSPGGVYLANLLPIPGVPWTEALERAAHPWRRARAVHFQEYENRVVVAGPRIPAAGLVSRRLRAALRLLGSRQADRVSVRNAKG
jgi:spermidine synthase